jgi:hypothetical protein
MFNNVNPIQSISFIKNIKTSALKWWCRNIVFIKQIPCVTSWLALVASLRWRKLHKNKLPSWRLSVQERWGTYRSFCVNYTRVDCERSLLSAGLDFQACERKGGTADNTSRNEIRVAHTTQNSHWSKSIRLSIKSDTWWLCYK